MSAGEPVIVYGLCGEYAQYNSLFAHVQGCDKHENRFFITLDGNTDVRLAVHDDNLFFTAKLEQYFGFPVDTLPWITEFTKVVHTGPGDRFSVVATKPIPAGALFACPNYRVTITWPQIKAVEAEFAAFMTDNLYRLMGRPEDSLTVVFEPNYNPVLAFVGEVAKVMRHHALLPLVHYDSASDDCLRQEWRRCNGQDLLWYEFWRNKLPHLTALEVWHVWHFVRNYPLPTRDRLTLVFGQTVCRMQNHPEREAEYEKVSDGQQDVSVDKFKHRHMPTFIVNPECGEALKAYSMTDLEVGQPVFTDNGPSFRNNLCDTVLGCLFMPVVDGERWLAVYNNILSQVSKPVARHFLAYFQANVARVKLLRPAPSVRTTPAVHAPPVPRCNYCAKPMLFPFVCALCRDAAYCGKACQTAAWQTHKKECKKEKECKKAGAD